MLLPHRKRVKHFDERTEVHELTFSCFQRRPLLTNDLWRTWFCEGINAACERQKFLLLAYVLMPEHVHLLVWPMRLSNEVEAKSRIARFLSDLKRPFSCRIKRELQKNGSPLLERLTIRQLPGVMAFRFWQEGPGYDRNLSEPESVVTAIDYIHANPVRRQLCQQAVDWSWSSARRLITDSLLEGLPKLGRFDPSLLELDSRPQRPRA